MENDENEEIISGAAGAPEGAATEPTTEEIQSLYDATGVKAPVPTSKAKGRPKSTSVRAEDATKNKPGSTDSGKEKDTDDKGKSKNAPASDKDVDSGNNPDTKGAKKRSDSTKVSDKSEEVDAGVRDTEPGSEGNPKLGSEEDAKLGTDGARQEAHAEERSEEEGQDAEGKRPGKSNPAIEQRFQKITAESKAKDEIIEKLQSELRENTQKAAQAKIAQEDPEYTVEDFRKVKDEEGNVIDLDPNQAELVYRRWKDGFEQRKAERDAQTHFEATLETAQQEAQDKMMKSSVEAYDTLASILDEYPALDQNSPDFDKEFSADVMPLINDAIVYLEGTQPGNEDGYQPVIVGLNINPKNILAVIDKVQAKKRSLPLNGLDDNVESRSNVSVPHGRSSDPTVKAANELMQNLGIDKRF